MGHSKEIEAATEHAQKLLSNYCKKQYIAGWEKIKEENPSDYKVIPLYGVVSNPEDSKQSIFPTEENV